MVTMILLSYFLVQMEAQSDAVKHDPQMIEFVIHLQEVFPQMGKMLAQIFQGPQE